MGNWRRVKIEGFCDASEVRDLAKALDPGKDFENFHCLCHTGALCGLPNWASEMIIAVGNLAERDYDQQDVADALNELVVLCPSLDVRVHVGEENESKDCVATVTAKNGEVVIEDAQLFQIPDLNPQTVGNNLFSHLTKPPGNT